MGWRPVNHVLKVGYSGPWCVASEIGLPSACLGVPVGYPRTAKAATRHIRIELTRNYSLAPVLFDVAGVMNSLSDFAD